MTEKRRKRGTRQGEERKKKYEAGPRASERKKNYEAGPRIENLSGKKGAKRYEAGPKNNDFSKKKNSKKKFNRSKRPVQQSSGFGGPSFSHEKTGDMFKIYCKNQYETHASRSRELNNNIY